MAWSPWTQKKLQQDGPSAKPPRKDMSQQPVAGGRTLQSVESAKHMSVQKVMPIPQKKHQTADKATDSSAKRNYKSVDNKSTKAVLDEYLPEQVSA